MHLAARGFAGDAKPVANLSILFPEREAPHAALRRAAEFRRRVDVIPQPFRVDVEIGQPLCHGTLSEDFSKAILSQAKGAPPAPLRPPKRALPKAAPHENTAGTDRPAASTLYI